MKEISRQSLLKIHDVIHGQNYVNIKARLNQLLPDEYAKAFAGIKLFSTDGVWYGDDSVTYHPYGEANPWEREEIAIWLEECKEIVCSTLSTAMPYVYSLFSIPSKDQIFWYRNEKGNVQVILAQWGFESKSNDSKVDVIGMLISAPRTILQQNVIVHIDYSDGSTASNIPFKLFLFNNIKEVQTDENGDFHLGKLFANKTFSIENIEGTNHFDYTAVQDGSYSAIFDWYTKYSIIVENQDNLPIPNFDIVVDGVTAKTNDDGLHEKKIKLLANTAITVKVRDTQNTFTLQQEAEKNVFRIIINEDISLPPVPPIPPVPSFSPTPPASQYIKVSLLDFNGQPLPNLSFSIRTKNGDVINAQTDEKGIAQIDKSQFNQKNKYHIEFIITSAYRENRNKNEK